MISDATKAAASDLLVSLPPMESQAWKEAQNQMNSLLLVRCSSTNTAGILSEAEDRRARAQCTSSSTIPPLEDSQFRSIEKRLRDYQSQRYNHSGTVVVRCSVHHVASTTTTATPTSGGVLRTYCEHLDPSNCLAGSLTGEWHVNITSEKTADLSATLRWHAHYSEDSNVQTRSTREYPVIVVRTDEEKVNAMVKQFEKEQMSYEEQLAKALVQQVERWERDFYTALKGIEDAPDLVRPLRRILPITKTRFKWDSAAQKNVQLLNLRKKM